LRFEVDGLRAVSDFWTTSRRSKAIYRTFVICPCITVVIRGSRMCAVAAGDVRDYGLRRLGWNVWGSTDSPFCDNGTNHYQLATLQTRDGLKGHLFLDSY
jgi:hypothetical protein